jgi:hypothetical protein
MFAAMRSAQPELVSPAERVQAISLGSVNQNLARAVNSRKQPGSPAKPT